MVEANILKAVQTALEQSKAQGRKFKQTVDLAINLRNVDLSVPKNRIEEEIPLPHGRGREVKVAIFATGDLAAKSKASADVVITPDQISEFAGDKKKFKKVAGGVTFFMAEAPLMPTIGKSLGVVLGPRGKMPRPVPPSADPKPVVEMLKKTIKVRSKDKPTFHTIVGSEDMTAEQLAENVEIVLKRVEARLEHGRMNIRSAYVKTTMGPAVKVV
jgi:large subunit ribosomal protein L1